MHNAIINATVILYKDRITRVFLKHRLSSKLVTQLSLFSLLGLHMYNAIINATAILYKDRITRVILKHRSIFQISRTLHYFFL